MALDTSRAQIVLQSWLDANAKQLNNFILGIYGVGDDSRPTHLGTCFLVNGISDRYLITAGHVLNNKSEMSLKLLTPTGFCDLDEPFFRSVVRNGNPSTDIIDIAFLPLSNNLLHKLKNLEGLALDCLNSVPDTNSGHILAAAGLPSTKNEPDHRLRHIQVQPYLISGAAKLCPNALKDFGFSDSTHLFIHHSKRHGFFSDGTRTNSPKLIGMSGGPVLYLGSDAQLSAPKIEYGKIRVVGVLIEQHKNYSVLIGSKVGDLPNVFLRLETPKV
ncbi:MULTISPECIES: hypothetical protein [Hyphomonas]|uniref:hypothetical protein n=1 Tax=Hyphomonas TaxID=85 RepID=UPI0011D0B5D1|nr:MULTISPECIES: hypothetical protein [Hyphomonas]